MLIGFMIMAFGLLFLLRNLNIIYVDDIWRYWPVILIVIGGLKLISPQGAHDIFPGLIIGGIGVYFLLRNLGIIYGSIWQHMWPLILIAVGAAMLIHHLDRGARTFRHGRVGSGNRSDSLLDIDVVFHQFHRKANSQQFAGGKISAVFGDVKIDLRGAAIEQEEVTIEACSVFSGIEIVVPEVWDVEVRGGGPLGNIDDRTRKPAFVSGAPAKRLIVLADTVFGAVIVRN
jgi:predicted membrane protein